MDPTKKVYPSAAQKNRLLSILEADEELRQGKFSASFSKKEAQLRWVRIADEINGIPGSKKDWKEWKKTWQDIKSKTKKKQSAINRARNSTGGGPPVPPLSEEETIVLRTISEAALVGHQDSQESAVEFLDTTPQAAEISTPAMEERHFEPTENRIVDEVIQENIIHSENRRTPRRTQANRRLQRSLDVATALEKTLKEKNELKKEFYKSYIAEIRRQTDALFLIAGNLAHP